MALVTVSAALCVAAFVWVIGHHEETFVWSAFDWISAGRFHLAWGFQVDALTGVMLLVVGIIGMLVHYYSIGYMHGDEGYYRFFAYLNLFMFAMFILVLADNYLLMFLGWEGVGLCSYLLISFWFRKKSASQAGKKAFLVNRVGDFGFTLGMLLIFVTTGTLQFTGVFEKAESMTGAGIATWICLLLFIGAVGKSAQFPLHVWLPDAMEGPTPVSALIHAATMVNAGVYMVARSYPLFINAHAAMLVVMIVGTFTAIYAAYIAITQNDIKKVIAYSTISSLGFMFMALGAGAWVAAHLLPVRARLLQGPAVPLLRLGHPRHVRRAGHAQDGRPAQEACRSPSGRCSIGAVALIGVFPFAGLLGQGRDPRRRLRRRLLRGVGRRHRHRLPHGDLHVPHSCSSPSAARAVRRRGAAPHPRVAARDDAAARPAGHPVGRSWACSSAWPPEAGWIHSFLEPVFFDVEHEDFEWLGAGGALMLLSLAIVLIGVYVAYVLYIRQTELPGRIAARFPCGLQGRRCDKMYMDEVYEVGPIRSTIGLSGWLWTFFDTKVIDGAVNGLARLWDWFGRHCGRCRPVASRTTPSASSPAWSCS